MRLRQTRRAVVAVLAACNHVENDNLDCNFKTSVIYRHASAHLLTIPIFHVPGSSSPHSVSFHLASGDHRRVQQEPRRQRGRRHRQVQGGQRQVSKAVRDAGRGEAGQLLLLQLLEGQGASTGVALPQHQPPLLLLLLTRKRRLDLF